MPLSQYRIESINLYNYIKYEVLGLSFIEQYENEPLSYDSSTALYVPAYEDMSPSPISIGRGWTVFDEASGVIDTTAEQTSRVSVVGSSSYEIDYIRGGISSSVTPSAVSFFYNYVSVLDGWPGTTPPELPIVAIDIVDQKRQGFQLGLGYTSLRGVDLHIFASTAAERDDLSEVLFDALYLKSIPLVDYTTGDYLSPNGKYDSSFSRVFLTKTPKMYFDSVVNKNVSIPTTDWSDLNRNRAIISFDAFVYKG